VAIGTLAQRAWQRPPGRLRLEAATFSGGIAVLGGGPENALQPRHARPQQEFLRNNARSARSSVPPSPSAGEIRWQKLAAAQRFPSGYRFAGNQGDKVKQIGNAVPLDVAKALVLAPLGAA
jgi:site-specific DNA-cytosine methylase